ncbi:MAG: hypothetical protein HND58_01175 [Planctomycetota bacterium]|nr:MAG: hypothetical protein HND58_01175 [Planctomycetota bacterium]
MPTKPPMASSSGTRPTAGMQQPMTVSAPVMVENRAMRLRRSGVAWWAGTSEPNSPKRG